MAALEHHADDAGVFTYNLGTGVGTSVLELISAYETASGQPIPYEIMPRRAGDVAANWANVGKARKAFDWKAKRGLEDMCIDSWRWHQNAR